MFRTPKTNPSRARTISLSGTASRSVGIRRNTVSNTMSSSARAQDLARLLVERYDGRADALWTDVPDGATLLRRLGELPGFGAQKSKIFLALLGKQCGVTPPGWRAAAGAYGAERSRRSVADITGPASLAEVRATKQQLKQAAKEARAAQQG
jgi:uncharacterized HhH-GPD family protein